MNTKLVDGKRILSKKLKWDYTLRGLEKTYTDFLLELNFNSDLVLERNDIGVKVMMGYNASQFTIEFFYLSNNEYIKHTHIVFKTFIRNMVEHRECYINQKQITFDIDKVAKEIIPIVRKCWDLSYG
jgi:hypothetical protein